MKILKRVLSAFLAVLMCIPSGIITTVNAAESSMGGDYTVMLADGENGVLQFSEEYMKLSTASQKGYNMIQVSEDGSMNQVENDGSIWAFKEGDKVEVETIPCDGYHVESFSVFPPFQFLFQRKQGRLFRPLRCRNRTESSSPPSFPLGIFKNLTKIPVI